LVMPDISFHGRPMQAPAFAYFSDRFGKTLALNLSLSEQS
jgi:hypothetical protein